MLSFQEARQALLRTVQPLAPEERPLREVFGHYLACDIAAPHDHPRFDHSAVDGYCFAWESDRTRWDLVGRAAAGDRPPPSLAPGQCLRILTGAQLPPGADTVVMQEHVAMDGATITHADERLKQGANVRRQGEQFRAGDIVLQRGVRLDAAGVGLLLSAGVDRVAVHRRPRVAVVVTGNEFCSPDEPLPGHIFSSNGEMLLAALLQEGIQADLSHAPDEHVPLREALDTALRSHDLVVTTGGVSVGDLDLVRPVLEELGTHIHFHKVAQKPGKPMLMGTRGDRLVLGLPGNPRAVLILFWLHVLPALRALQGAAEPCLLCEELPLTDTIGTKGGRTELRAARVRHGQVELLRDEGSHMLASLITADALAEIPPDAREIPKGTTVCVHHLPRR